MNENKEFLGTEPVGRLLFRLAVPTVVAQLINMLYNLVDRIYIGHMPGDGTLALTGVGVCLPLIMLVSAFAFLVGTGGAPRASICMGKHDIPSAEKILGNCFTLQLFVSVTLTAVLLIWNEDLLWAFGASEETIGYGVDYMNIYALGTMFVQITLGMNMFITAQGFTKVSMLSVVIGAATNIILDPIFIFGLHMGVQGAAFATIISQLLSTIWILVFLTGKKTLLKIKIRNMIPDFKVLLPCIGLGVAPFIMQASESVINVCFNASLQQYGGDIAVGAMTILSSITMFAMLPLQGIAMGAQPITSYNYGARKPDRVRKTFRLLLISGLTYSTTLWALVMLFPTTFAHIFSPNPELIAFTGKALRIYGAAIFVFGLQMSCQMTFTALGYAVESSIVAIVRKFVLLLPLIYLVPHLVSNPTMGVYLAEPIADVIAVTFAAALFRYRFKKSMAALEQPE